MRLPYPMAGGGKVDVEVRAMNGTRLARWAEESRSPGDKTLRVFIPGKTIPSGIHTLVLTVREGKRSTCSANPPKVLRPEPEPVPDPAGARAPVDCRPARSEAQFRDDTLHDGFGGRIHLYHQRVLRFLQDFELAAQEGRFERVSLPALEPLFQDRVFPP